MRKTRFVARRKLDACDPCIEQGLKMEHFQRATRGSNAI